MNEYRNTQLTKEQIPKHLQIAAKAYNKYADKLLLFIYQKNVRSDCEMIKVRFGKENFMHLVGVKSKCPIPSGMWDIFYKNQVDYPCARKTKSAL